MRRSALTAFILIAICTGPFQIAAGAPGEAPPRDIWYKDLMPDMPLNMADVRFLGMEANANAGSLVDADGDLNGDGLNDIAVADKGSVMIIFGRPAPWNPTMPLMEADVTIASPQPITSLDCGGDVNGDGYDDLIAGNPVGPGSSPAYGEVYLVLGRRAAWPRNMLFSDANSTFMGEEWDDKAGEGVSFAGDLNGDGFDDILIGAPENDEPSSKMGKVYLVLGSPFGWETFLQLSDVKDTFIGENADDEAGDRLAGIGDINGDGLEDAAIGSFGNDEGGNAAGQVYIILGRRGAFGENIPLSVVNASIVGEWAGDSFTEVCGAGDFDGDGLSDLAVGAWRNDEGGSAAGKVYIFLGKKQGWAMDMSAESADLILVGEDQNSLAGMDVEPAGDVNGDGFDDLLIAAPWNGEMTSMAGQVYLVLGGRRGQWTQKDLSRADASFLGEGSSDEAGTSIAGVGDVNGDSGPDILIGAKYADEGFMNAGKAYLFLLGRNDEPEDILSLGIFSDSECLQPITYSEVGHQVFVEVQGVDRNASNIDRTWAMVKSSAGENETIRINLIETGTSTGRYQGSFFIKPDTKQRDFWVQAQIEDTITVTSLRDPSFTGSILVNTPVQIRPRIKSLTIQQDSKVSLTFHTFGYNQPSEWSVDIPGDWLSWDLDKLELSGTPDNSDVGYMTVTLNVTDGVGHYDELKISVTVENIDPTLYGTDVVSVHQGESYHSDYFCDEDGIGSIRYHVYSNRSWLVMNESTGELSGVPGNDDVGVMLVVVSVDDGNYGWDSREFNLTVINVNDPPRIITEDVLQITEGDPFLRHYEAEDVDIGDQLEWGFSTDAPFLSMDLEEAALSGTPGPEDVGSFFVNVSVFDLLGEMDFHNFTLEVSNINNAPVFIDAPADMELVHGTVLSFDINATDPDTSDIVAYSIRSEPRSDISINESTGLLEWRASVKWFEDVPFEMSVSVIAYDGLLNSTHTFRIKVLPTASPLVRLVHPKEGSKVSFQRPKLEWSGSDPENEPLTYDLYLSDQRAFVEGRREESLLAEGINSTSYELRGMVQGRTYYWTVEVYDGCTYGVCPDGILSFRLNNVPGMEAIPPQVATTGSEFKLKVTWSDPDPEDRNKMAFSLADPPEGMRISNETGMIRWTPGSDQTGLFEIEVVLSDGYDEAVVTFKVNVNEGKGGSSLFPLVLAVIVVLILIVAAAIVFMVVKKRKRAKRPAPISRELKKVDTVKQAGAPASVVPISPTEAYASLQKGGKQLSYEELYGAPAPKEEDGLTTKELKEYISGQIQELEVKEPPAPEVQEEQQEPPAEKEAPPKADEGATPPGPSVG